MALTDQFIEEQKQKLEDKRRKTREEVDRLKKESLTNDPDTNIVDDDDDAQEFVQIDENTQKVSELEALLDQIDKALAAISAGTYGTDERTGEPISKERLEAYPEATTVA